MDIKEGRQKNLFKIHLNIRKLTGVAGIILALAVTGYFPLSEWIDANRRQAIIETLDTTIIDAPSEHKKELLKQAQAYNAALGNYSDETQVSEILPYDKQLLLNNDSSQPIATVIIPQINQTIPVYHYAEGDSLVAGAGHVYGTSLPVGGKSSHCVIAAHTGSGKMEAFNEIRKLQPGDIFAIRTLGEDYTYSVTGSEVVLPDEVDRLKVEEGKDMVTLLTCTPIGVNSHRLLLTAERIHTTELFDSTSQQTVFQAVTNIRIYPFLITVAIAVISGIVSVFSDRRKKREAEIFAQYMNSQYPNNQQCFFNDRNEWR